MATVAKTRSKHNTLLRLRGKLTWRRFTKETGRIIGVILGLIFFLPMTVSMGIGSWVGYTRAPDQWPFQIAGLVLVGLWFAWITLPLIAASLTDSIDLDNLLIYPITRRDLVLSNIYGTLFDYQAYIALPLFVAIVVGFGGFGGLSHPDSSLQMLPLLIVVCGVGYGLMVVSSQLLLTLLGGILQSRRTRDVAFVLLSLFGFSCWAISQLAPRMVESLGVFTNLDPEQLAAWRPLDVLQWLPTGALAKSIEQATLDNWLMVGLWVAYALVWLFGLAWAWGALLERLLTGQGFLLGGGEGVERKSKEKAWGLGWLSGVISAETHFIAAKELKAMWRTPQRRIGLLQAFLMPLVFIVLPFVQGGSSPFSVEQASGNTRFLIPSYTLILMWFLGQNMLGWEHSGLPTLLLMPMERWRIFLGKSVAVLLVGLPPLALIGIALTFWSGDFTNLFWTLLGLLMALPTLAVHAVASAYFPYPVQLNFKTNRNSFSRGGCLAAIAILIPVPIAFVLLNLPMIAPLVISQFAPSLAWVGIICAAFSVVWAPFIFWRGMKLAGRVLADREPEVIAAAKPTVND